MIDELSHSRRLSPAEAAAAVYIATREAEGHSKVTTLNRRRLIARFLACPTTPPDVRDFTADTLILWIKDQRDRGLTPASIRAEQAGVYAWIGWLIERGDLREDIRARVRRIKVPETRPRVASRDTIGRSMRVLQDRRTGTDGRPVRNENAFRDSAIVALLWSSGLRRRELVSLDLADLDLAGHTVLVRHGKGGKMRVAPFDAATAARVHEYIARERGDAAGPLFLARGGRRLSPEGISSLFTRLGKRLGEHVSPHDLRRGYAANAVRVGVDISELATLLGHSTLSMAVHYARTGREDAAIRAYREKIG